MTDAAGRNGPLPRPLVFDAGERVTQGQEMAHWAALLGARVGIRAAEADARDFLDRMAQLQARMGVRWGVTLTALELGALTDDDAAEMCALALAAFRVAARSAKTNEWLEKACGWRAGELSAAESLFCGVWRIDLPSGESRVEARRKARARALPHKPETYWRDFYESWWTGTAVDLDPWQASEPPPAESSETWRGVPAVIAPVFRAALDRGVHPGCKGVLPTIPPADPVDLLALDPADPTRFFAYRQAAGAYPRPLEDLFAVEWAGRAPRRLRLYRFPIDLLRDSAPGRCLETGAVPGVVSGRVCVLDWMTSGADQLAQAIDRGQCVPVCDDAHHAEWLKKLVRESKPRLKFEIAAEMAADAAALVRDTKTVAAAAE